MPKPFANPVELFARVRGSVAQVLLVCGTNRSRAGTAFLTTRGIVSNSHVVRVSRFDSIEFAFEATGQCKAETLQCAADEFNNRMVVFEDTENGWDQICIDIGGRLPGRHRIEFGDSSTVQVGEQILFLGYPLDVRALTSHVGFVSSLYSHAGVDVIQIDGSVNAGNSGGPLLLMDGTLIGVITRKNHGFVASVDSMIAIIEDNIEGIKRGAGSGVRLGGIDFAASLLSTQGALHQIAINLRRSANVGIGYAFRTDFLKSKTETRDHGELA